MDDHVKHLLSQHPPALYPLGAPRLVRRNSFYYSRHVLKLGVRLSIFFCLLLAFAGGEPAPPTARADIQAAYAKAALGARLKFVHGMLCHRSADFELFGPDGRKLDLTLERERFRRLFEPATRVELTTKIVLFESKGNRAD